jgi:hypothetical protein
MPDMSEEERIQAFYRKHGKAPPKHFEHGTEDDIKDNMVLLKPKQWRMEGHTLIAETEHGTHVQNIPTDQILIGTDDDGLPVFRKVVLS